MTRNGAVIGIELRSRPQTAFQMNTNNNISTAFNRLFTSVNAGQAAIVQQSAETEVSEVGSRPQYLDLQVGLQENVGVLNCSDKQFAELSSPDCNNQCLVTCGSLMAEGSLDDFLNTSQESQCTSRNVCSIIAAMKQNSVSHLNNSVSNLNSTAATSTSCASSVISEEEDNGGNDVSSNTETFDNTCNSMTAPNSEVETSQLDLTNALEKTDDDEKLKATASDASEDLTTQTTERRLRPRKSKGAILEMPKEKKHVQKKPKEERKHLQKNPTVEKEKDNLVQNRKLKPRKLKEASPVIPKNVKKISQKTSRNEKGKEGSGAVHSEQKGTVLLDWIIKPMPDSRGVCVEGQKQGMEDFWHSTAIVEAKKPKVVVTVTGSIYRLKGRINKLCTMDNGFSKEVARAFANGFPKNWREIIQEFYKNLEDSISIEAEYSPLKNFKLTKLLKRQKPKTVKKVEEDPLCAQSIWTPAGVINKEITNHDVTTTRSGRLSLPPLAGWIGQRYAKVSGTNTLQVICETDSAEKAISKETRDIFKLSKKVQKMIYHKSLSKSLLLPNSSVMQKGKEKKHQTFNGHGESGPGVSGSSIQEKVEIVSKRLTDQIDKNSDTEQCTGAKDRLDVSVDLSDSKVETDLLCNGETSVKLTDSQQGMGKKPALGPRNARRKRSSSVRKTKYAKEPTSISDDTVIEVCAGNIKEKGVDYLMSQRFSLTDEALGRLNQHGKASIKESKDCSDKINSPDASKTSCLDNKDAPAMSKEQLPSSNPKQLKRNDRGRLAKNKKTKNTVLRKDSSKTPPGKLPVKHRRTEEEHVNGGTTRRQTRRSKPDALKESNSTLISDSQANDVELQATKGKSKVKSPQPQQSGKSESTKKEPRGRKRTLQARESEEDGKHTPSLSGSRKRRKLKRHIDDSWTEEEDECLKKAVLEVNGAEPDYWRRVAEAVGTRSEAECQQYHKEYLEDITKQKQKRPSKKQEKSKKNNGRQKGEAVRGGKGTLKRKQDLRDFLDEQNDGYEDNLFESTPFVARKKGTSAFAVEVDKDDSDIFGANHDVFTPAPSKSLLGTPGTRLRAKLASVKKTPAGANLTTVDTPVSVDRREADRYVKAFKDRKKKPAPVLAVAELAAESLELSDLPVRSIFTPATHPSIIVDRQGTGEDDDDDESPFVYYWNDEEF